MAWAGPASTGDQLERLFSKRSTADPGRAFSVGILSTYPSAQGSVATFAASLADAFVSAAPQMSVHIVRLLSAQPPLPYQDDVLEPPHRVETGSPEAAAELNKFDVVIVPHEYGIHSHADAEQLLDLIELLRVPVVLVVRTIPAEPTAHQRHVLEILAMSADAVVAMSQSAHRRLLDEYRVEPHRLAIIPQGAATSDTVAGATWRTGRPTVLTWGLLAPGKGIEWGIDALAAMNLLRPRPRYVVIGRTHPEVAPEEGAKYREFLAQRAVDRGVAHLVEFEPAFASPQRLGELLRQADVVLLPYDSRDQVTSGVLTQALAAKLPVVSTRFPHAQELLGDGRGGILVPHEDPAAIAKALTRIIVEPGVAAAMSVHNAVFASLMSWPTVADSYRLLLDTVTRRHSTPSR
jgi:glycosyltransferase involved in cell wall biosynthesis